MQKAYEEGFIPGPNESEEDFFARIAKVKEVMENPESLDQKKLKASSFISLSPSLLGFTSKAFMWPWHGSMTWIIDLSKKVRLPLLQLPTKLADQLTNQEEVIAHEMVHAKRVMFNSPKFEEIIAYRTSKNRWRRYLSPLFFHTYEPLLLLLAYFVFLFTGKVAFFFGLAFLSLRLIYYQSHFKRALSTFGGWKDPEAVMQALTDKEILTISKKGIDAVDKSSYRWQFILTALQ